MQSEMTPHEIANEIGVRQIQSRIYGEGETFVMVEGKTDEVLWEEYRSREDCTLYPAHGKDKIIAALGVAKKRGMCGIAGIVDADYWLIIDADELATENLLYDACCPDMESLLLCSPALKKVLRNNFYDYEIEDIHEFAEKVTKKAQALAMEFGYFRLLNHLKDYGLRCNAIRFDEVIDKNTLELDRDWIAKRLAEDNADISSEELLRQVEELRVAYPPGDTQLCRGKDVAAIMAMILPLHFKAEFGDDLLPSMNDKELSIRLRTAYEYGYFKQTSLFVCIQEWESANCPYKILKPEI